MSEVPVTVLMSVYNGDRWLDQSIPSVLNQTFRDFEFLIVNDGSTDRTLEIIYGYALCDPRIRLLDKQNSGLTDSLNYGITQAKGQWIARIDADDICEPERLERQYDLSQSDTSLVLIGTGLQKIDEYGNFGKIFKYPCKHKQLLRRLVFVGPFAHSSAFYKTNEVRKLGGYRPKLHRAQDLDLWLRLSEVGRLACIDLSLVRIRSHDMQITHDEGGRRQFVDSRVVMVSYWSRRYGFDDPLSGTNSEENFTEFRNWVSESLARAGLFDLLSFVQKVKKRIGETKGELNKLFVLLFSLIDHPVLCFCYLHRRIIGERLTRSLAKEWVRRNQS